MFNRGQCLTRLHCKLIGVVFAGEGLATNWRRRSTALNELADCEEDVEKAEEDIELYRLKRLVPLYNRRDEIIERIPGFWRVVLSQHDEFADHIKASDFKYVDAIKSIIVHWKTFQDYEIEFKFNAIEGELKEQTIRKHFSLKDEQLISEPVDIGVSGTTERKSFVDWFNWTGVSNEKEFPDGGELAALFSEDIYPYCVKYYTEAQRDVEDEESADNSSEGELILD
ncbi:hypothetical protein HG537_0A06780 [Torulaspora globosa]|uniref:Uncharacterized protein n=1 Tax=Torulaspora globosa TaxID=48254 RepID=A0A7H9HMJ9_9SACH|nr:hypothetical protein HG537_0A06780 [Torulaspora sp. CBS 2947]